MIFQQSKILIADNTGAKLAKCIGMLGQSKVGKVGKIITVSICDTKSGATKVKKGEKHKALIVRTKKPIQRPNGQWVRFDDNAAILLTPDFSPLGTRISGPIAQELRTSTWAKVLSLTQHIL